jgi:hypothetical protein
VKLSLTFVKPFYCSYCRDKYAPAVVWDVLPENLDDVFYDFKLGWIDARTFSEPLGEKTKLALICKTKVFYIDLLEGRY